MLIVLGLSTAYAEDLQSLRAARRDAVRAAALTKVAGGAPCGLLVIPIEFADASFPAGFSPELSLAPRVAADEAGGLAHYFTVASQGRTSLDIVMAPVVSLAGSRVDYSDLGWQGFSRSRTMVSEALAGASALGVSFAAADADADGEVDGILLVHAAPGLENDPGGLIVPQQFFLAEPVVQRGTVARSYAMVAARSTLGIWAHETAHLLGLEDRYDPNLAADETLPRGGLGRFSLMASGWLGSGDGHDPALPDGYSRLQLGWADLAAGLAPAKVVRLGAQGPAGPDYFLVEQRDPALVAPYDGALPDDRALVYHIDESLADGEVSSGDWPARHLRVQLVEADGGMEVARGEETGSPADLFPRDGTQQDLNADSLPSSRTWQGDDTGVAVQFRVGDAGVAMSETSGRIRCDLRLILPPAGTTGAIDILGRIEDGATALETIPVTITAETAWGLFDSGEPDSVLQVNLRRDTSGEWANYVLAESVSWVPAPVVSPDARTRFSVVFAGGVVGDATHDYPWHRDAAPLTPDSGWPEDWDLASEGGTTWHRWQGADTAALPDSWLLACTGTQFTTAGSWPEVSYTNDAWARVLSPPLGTDVRWVSLTHAVDIEVLHESVAIDGVALTWVHDGGAEVPAEPSDGWLGTVDARAQHRLVGGSTFAVVDSLRGDDQPLWRREVLPLPSATLHGPGPWRLRCELASDRLWRGRGWLIRDLVGHTDTPPSSSFPVSLEADVLSWSWQGDDVPQRFLIERSSDAGQAWQTVVVDSSGALDRTVARERLGLLPGVRSRLRVVASGDGFVTSRRIVGEAVALEILALPRPNPAGEWVSLHVDGLSDPAATLALYDLRGRMVRDWRVGAGQREIRWDGTERAGKRVASGVYIFRMRAQGRTLTRKVTWLP